MFGIKYTTIVQLLQFVSYCVLASCTKQFQPLLEAVLGEDTVVDDSFEISGLIVLDLHLGNMAIST